MKRILRSLPFFCVCIISLFVLFQNTFKVMSLVKTETKLTTPIAKQDPTETPIPQPTITPPIINELQKAIDEELEGTKGEYSIVIKNLMTNETYTLNEHKQYLSGSLYKLWVMGSAYEKIKDGSLSLDEILSDDIADLNERFDIATQDAELTDGSISLTVGQALNQMITLSHNYSALLLTKRLKLESLSAFLKEYGYNESKVGEPPKTTAYDIAGFFEKVYRKELVTEAYSDKMLDLLKDQQLNTKLPRFLPEDVTVAHKTGELYFYSHDAGIVFTPKGDYIIVILTNSDNVDRQNEIISDISKSAYDYFMK